MRAFGDDMDGGGWMRARSERTSGRQRAIDHVAIFPKFPGLLADLALVPAAMAPATDKKRKHAAENTSPHKKAKKDEPPKKDKGKARATPAESEFQVVKASLVISIPPAFTADPSRGALEMLDSMVMRCATTYPRRVLLVTTISQIHTSLPRRRPLPFPPRIPIPRRPNS